MSVQVREDSRGLKLCVNTQTPLVQFTGDGASWSGRETVDLAQLKEDVDYHFSPGGVARMVYPLLRRMQEDGLAGDVHWVSLNRMGPETARAGGITLRRVSMDDMRMAGYGKVKEAIWGAAHGTGDGRRAAKDVFWSQAFSEYTYYNSLTAETIAALDRAHDFDLFYVHDFQQLPVGKLLGTLKPKLYRWHIPFDETLLPRDWREALAGYFNAYDAVIVSTSKYLASLKSIGYSGRTARIYPYIDPADFSRPTGPEVEGVSAKLGLGKRAKVALMVARLDPQKGHDRAIRAFSRIAKEYPDLKLVFVGNGSFSSSGQGLGLPKADVLKRNLEALAKRLGVESRVVFAGHLTQTELDAMYERCEFSLLSSTKEGFGLVVIESWIHRRPCLVTERAGVAELFDGSRTNPLFDPDDSDELAELMGRVLSDRRARQRLVREGVSKSTMCLLDAGAKAESKVVESLVGGR